jgi:arylsulfatase A-like enzyme
VKTDAVRPNVLLVVLDAARRDALEPYGAPAGSTPAIAQLAARGRALPEVYATGCWTAPSHASMFTGLLPRAAGLSRVPSPMAAAHVMESHRDRLLPEVMRRAGYSTAAVSANVWISESSGFATGFDEFVSVDSGRHAHAHAHGRRAHLRWLAEAARANVDDGASESERAFERWIAQPRDRPFFWFANVVECHSPYLPPRPYGDVSLRDRLRAAEAARNYYSLGTIWRACVGGRTVPTATMELLHRLYRASIRYMDDWLGRLLERLDAAGFLDDTLVIVTADHGENFGEAGLISHALSLDNRLIHVPFVIGGPGADHAAITSLAELPRLVAAVAGEAEHPWTDGPPRGVGVAQFDAPIDDPRDPRVVEATEEWGLGEEGAMRFAAPLTCAVSGGLKLLLRGTDEEVYDLAADPLELSAMSPDALEPGRADALAKLRGALAHPAVTSVMPEQASAAAAGPPTEAELSEIEERMKLLGYM